MASEYVTLTKDNFEQEVTKFDGVVLIDYWAAWCGPCRVMAPRIDALAEKFSGDARVKIAKLDVDAEPELSEQQQIFSLPTFKVFAKGEFVHQVPGLIPQAALDALLNIGIEKLGAPAAV